MDQGKVVEEGPPESPSGASENARTPELPHGRDRPIGMLALSQLRRVQVSRKQGQLKKANSEQELVPLPEGVDRVQTAMGGRVNSSAISLPRFGPTRVEAAKSPWPRIDQKRGYRLPLPLATSRLQRAARVFWARRYSPADMPFDFFGARRFPSEPGLGHRCIFRRRRRQLPPICRAVQRAWWICTQIVELVHKSPRRASSGDDLLEFAWQDGGQLHRALIRTFDASRRTAIDDGHTGRVTFAI